MAPTAWILAGGGSFGAVQAGMLRALVAAGERPDLVVGSSVGAINGAYFAGTPTAAGVAQLEALWRGLRRRDVLRIGWRGVLGLLYRGFVVDPTGLRRLVDAHLPYRTLETAVVPVHLVATDLLAGGHGDAVQRPRRRRRARQLRDPGGVPAGALGRAAPD